MNKDEELINHLAEKLKSHELPYKEGAWEKFAQSQKVPVAKSGKLLRLLSPWTAVAAAVILMATGGVYFYNQEGGQKGITKAVTETALNKPVAPATIQNPSLQAPSTTPGTGIRDKSSAVEVAKDAPATSQTGPVRSATAMYNLATGSSEQADFQKNDIQNVNIISKDANANYTSKANVNILSGIERVQPGIKTIPPTIIGATVKSAVVSNNMTPKGMVPGGQQIPRTAPARQGSYVVAANAFDDQGYIDPDAPKSHQNKWDMGVMVVPGMGNDSKLNLGYGVNVGYKLNNKLSLNSGLAYSQMSGTKDVSAASDGITSGARSLSSIDANVTGVSLPLELRYNVSQKVYVGAGVSALAVISNKMDRHYSINQLQSTAFISKNGNLLNPKQIEALTSGIKTKESIPQQQIDSKNFAGFLNFSFGFKQKLNKSKSLSIEPFMSVPMSNNLSSQNIKLTDGGIRVKIGL